MLSLPRSPPTIWPSLPEVPRKGQETLFQGSAQNSSLQALAPPQNGDQGIWVLGGRAHLVGPLLLLAVQEHLLQSQEGQEASNDPQPQLLLLLQALPLTTCRGSTDRPGQARAVEGVPFGMGPSLG